MKRLSVMVTNGSHRLYDDPNGTLTNYEEAQKELHDSKRANGSIIRDLHKQIEELSGMVATATAVKRQCD